MKYKYAVEVSMLKLSRQARRAEKQSRKLPLTEGEGKLTEA
jgi:hypothetical protein